MNKTLYSGYTESQTMTDARAERIWQGVKLNFQLTHTTEADADAVANFINTAEAGDLEYGYENDDLYDWARGG